MTGARYAIYFAPEDDTALARFGWPWLGRDPYTISDAPFVPAADQASVVADPRLYGLHATLKPPFFLRDGTSPEAVSDAMRAFCADRQPFDSGPLQLDEIDGFLALRPSGDPKALNILAADCVAAFDPFRTPSSPADIAKRAARGLTERQHAYLLRWGYPYVFEEFRFHVTLTGRLPAADHAPLRARLMSLMADVVAEPLRVHSLCLFEQQQTGARFILKERHRFAG